MPATAAQYDDPALTPDLTAPPAVTLPPGATVALWDEAGNFLGDEPDTAWAYAEGDEGENPPAPAGMPDESTVLLGYAPPTTDPAVDSAPNLQLQEVVIPVLWTGPPVSIPVPALPLADEYTDPAPDERDDPDEYTEPQYAGDEDGDNPPPRMPTPTAPGEVVPVNANAGQTPTDGTEEKNAAPMLPKWFEELATISYTNDEQRGVTNEKFAKLFGVYLNRAAVPNPRGGVLVDGTFDLIAGKKTSFISEADMLAVMKADGEGAFIAMLVDEIYRLDVDAKTSYELLARGLAAYRGEDPVTPVSGGGGAVAGATPAAGGNTSSRPHPRQPGRLTGGGESGNEGQGTVGIQGLTDEQRAAQARTNRFLALANTTAAYAPSPTPMAPILAGRNPQGETQIERSAPEWAEIFKKEEPAGFARMGEIGTRLNTLTEYPNFFPGSKFLTPVGEETVSDTELKELEAEVAAIKAKFLAIARQRQNLRDATDAVALIGVVDPTGITSGIEAAGEAAQGNYDDAAFAMLGAIPLFGKLKKGAQLLRAERAAEATKRTEAIASLEKRRESMVHLALGEELGIPAKYRNAAKKEIERIDTEIAKIESLRPVVNTLDDIPTNVTGFDKWFDSLTPAEVKALYQKPAFRNKIEAQLRNGGSMHEYLMVAEAPHWKNWGVTAQQVKEEFAVAINELNTTVAKGWKHSTGLKGSRAPGSKTVHNELQRIIQESKSLDEFKKNIRTWADKYLNGGYDSLPPGFHK